MDGDTEDVWPLTDQGVTDWEFVFEDPYGGFIPLVEMANTPFVMKDCATVIIQQLFTRDDDAMNIMKFIIALNDIIPNDKEMGLDKDVLAAMRSDITALLRRIKRDRLKKAEIFLRRKAETDKERRTRAFPVTFESPEMP